eukprot:CAMPEP_0195519448 /NCGR_PEP_ID=MMETSP0794_2-20130614/14813_1 /TAXON_ID=515487 /ORGANISM="Stephanopyxis turris, Strain CCMP 815" /LENGTH=274 /DNA_ID=CAMNT_0040648603 /DNA_START=108 /DNA_END=932 /DNA_ORIENTATION=+
MLLKPDPSSIFTIFILVKSSVAFVTSISRHQTLHPNSRILETISAHHIQLAPACLYSNKFNGEDWSDKIRKASSNVQNAASGGGAETAAGVVLGGLIGGPFGALFGAQIGANVGSKRAAEKARLNEMKRMGITPEMLEMAKECGVALNRAIDGLKVTRESLETQQAYAKRLDQKNEQVYEEAKLAMSESNEDKARTLLMERQNLTEKLRKALQNCADERRRLQMMETNVEALEERAMEVDALLRRSVGAKGLQDTTMALDMEDPLLRKFRDLEG